MILGHQNTSHFDFGSAQKARGKPSVRANALVIPAKMLVLLYFGGYSGVTSRPALEASKIPPL
jgi:hypothetical protein